MQKAKKKAKKRHVPTAYRSRAPGTENFVACTHALHYATIRPDVSGRSTSESQSKITAAQKYSTVTSSTDPRSQQGETDTNHFHEKSSDTEEGWQRVHSRGSGLEYSTSICLLRGCTVRIVLQPKRSICQPLVSNTVLVMLYSIAEIEEWLQRDACLFAREFGALNPQNCLFQCKVLRRLQRMTFGQT